MISFSVPQANPTCPADHCPPLHPNNTEFDTTGENKTQKEEKWIPIHLQGMAL